MIKSPKEVIKNESDTCSTPGLIRKESGGTYRTRRLHTACFFSELILCSSWIRHIIHSRSRCGETRSCSTIKNAGELVMTG